MNFANRCFLDKISSKKIDESIIICGWVRSKEILDSIILLYIFDGTGIVACVIEKDKEIDNIQDEDVVYIEGVIKLLNNFIKSNTLDFTIVVTELQFLNKASDLPFKLSNRNHLLKGPFEHRHLKLRVLPSQQLFSNINEFYHSLRKYLYFNNFLEISTPILSHSTEEYGEGEFFVLNENLPDQFFVLPQSPQIYKQLLIMGGINRYFQFAKCFRSDSIEDSTHLLEFTQLDLEMAFVNTNDIILFIENMLSNLFKEQNINIKSPFPRYIFNEYKNNFMNHSTDNNELNFYWIMDFPLFLKVKDNYIPFHHPFVLPKKEDLYLLESAPEKVRIEGFELYLNGIEIGGGSMRPHIEEFQRIIFKHMKISNEFIEKKYGYFLKALNHGTPPHGGIAIGMERLLSILFKTKEITDVVPFPTNQIRNFDKETIFKRLEFIVSRYKP